MFPIKSLAHYNLSKDCFNPCEYLKNRGRTSLCNSLTQTKEIALDYLDKNKNSNSKVIIIILGDGAIEDFENCFKIKQELDQHEKINYSTVLLETPEWQEKYKDALRQIQEEFKSLASDGAFYVSTVDPDEVRKHMIKSITKVSQL
jgi:archaellum biogenesis ATPase FlaH